MGIWLQASALPTLALVSILGSESAERRPLPVFLCCLSAFQINGFSKKKTLLLRIPDTFAYASGIYQSGPF